ncbi:MAG: hypothetical protein IJ040_03720 [Lachnospiraceae bacterium]|nr:hypothetical protein [Lachnospiraceae bacterium]
MKKQYENLYRILDTYGRLVAFMENFRAEVNNTDESFYTEVVNGAAEDLSHVALSDIEILNTIGLQEYNPDTGMYTPKDNLSIEDFLGNNGSSLEPSVEGFKEIFEQTLDLSGESYTMAEIIAELEKGTRYSNNIHNPGLEALAFIVDCVSFGIKPLFDCISGYDIITGEELSDSEQGWRGVDAALSLLDIFGITKLASMGLKTIGREVLEEVVEQAEKW